jgi:hypothetical protein
MLNHRHFRFEQADISLWLRHSLAVRRLSVFLFGCGAVDQFYNFQIYIYSGLIHGRSGLESATASHRELSIRFLRTNLHSVQVRFGDKLNGFDDDRHFYPICISAGGSAPQKQGFVHWDSCRHRYGFSKGLSRRSVPIYAVLCALGSLDELFRPELLLPRNMDIRRAGRAVHHGGYAYSSSHENQNNRFPLAVAQMNIFSATEWL